MSFKTITEQEQQHGARLFLLPYVRRKLVQYSMMSRGWQGSTSQSNFCLLNMLCCRVESILLQCERKASEQLSEMAARTELDKSGPAALSQTVRLEQSQYCCAFTATKPVVSKLIPSHKHSMLWAWITFKKQGYNQCTVELLGHKERKGEDRGRTFPRCNDDNCISIRRESHTHTWDQIFNYSPNKVALLRSVQCCFTLYVDLPAGINQSLEKQTPS